MPSRTPSRARRLAAIAGLVAAFLPVACTEQPGADAPEPPTTAPSASNTKAPTKAPAAPASPVATLYVTHCGPCHGPTGRGDGALAPHLANPPRGLVSEPWRFIQGTSDADIRAGLMRIVADGIEPSGMPPFRTTLEPAQIERIVDYVIALRARAMNE